tara:strand:- start:581 stop:1138 length:558 start_codon:yes stop_codon:yes gene_type:complete
MDNTNNTFQVKKKIFLQGNFIGKYEANEYAVLNYCNLSKIHILEGKLDNVVKCNFNSLLNIKSDVLQHQDGFNVEVKLNDNLLQDKYIFIEEFYNTTIYDIVLSDHQIDDNDTFGVIKGKMICSLEYLHEFNLTEDKSYIIDKEIDFGDYKKSNIEQKKNVFTNFFAGIRKAISFVKSKFFAKNK